MADAGAWWQQLSGSSQNVLRWAHAFAQVRSQTAFQPGQDSSSVVTGGEVDALDVLAGLLIEHGQDSEPWDFFEHFGLPVGQFLHRSGVDPAALLAARDVSEREYPVPPIGSEVQAIVDYGIRSFASSDPEGLLSFKLLFGALLDTPNVASAGIAAALVARGAPALDVVASYREYATMRVDSGVSAS